MLRKIGTAQVLAVSFLIMLAMPSAGASAAVRPLASQATTPAQKIVLTNSSGNTSVLAIKGDKVIVALSNNGGTLRWSAAAVEPTSSANPAAPALVLKSETTWPKGASRTTFRVVNYGSARIVATGAPICKVAQVCPAFVILWTATVVVPVVDPPGPSAS
jgi:hypothetical protein